MDFRSESIAATLMSLNPELELKPEKSLWDSACGPRRLEAGDLTISHVFTRVLSMEVHTFCYTNILDFFPPLVVRMNRKEYQIDRGL